MRGGLGTHVTLGVFRPIHGLPPPAPPYHILPSTSNVFLQNGIYLSDGGGEERQGERGVKNIEQKTTILMYVIYQDRRMLC